MLLVKSESWIFRRKSPFFICGKIPNQTLWITTYLDVGLNSDLCIYFLKNPNRTLFFENEALLDSCNFAMFDLAFFHQSKKGDFLWSQFLPLCPFRRGVTDKVNFLGTPFNSAVYRLHTVSNTGPGPILVFSWKVFLFKRICWTNIFGEI